MNSSFINKILKASLMLAASIVWNAGFAQEATPAAASANTESNLMMFMLVGTAAILLLGILLLGNVMIKLAKLLVEKEKGKVLLILLSFIGTSLFAQEPAAVATNTAVVFNWDLIAAIAVISLELFTILFLLYMINKMAASLSDKKEEQKPAFQLPRLFDSINASVAIEKEADIMLDHDYDGIKELDNDLPPWWRYGFYISIVWSFAYLYYYHVYGAPLSEEEYNTEIMEAKAEVDAYMKKSANNVDESNVTLADASGIKEGLDVYKNNCAACHGNSGEGGVGPNVTDAYWLHGGDIASVFKSVKYGWPAKGMKSWQTDLSPVQMKNVTSYILSLQGTNPANGKAPEGEIHQAAATDSSATAKAEATRTN
jgi:cytochrome c oxidase cbb3-type subunit 3